MHIIFKAPFDDDHHVQAPAVPGQPLGTWFQPDVYAQITTVMVNDAFVDDWRTYEPQQSDRIDVFLKTGALFTSIAAGATIWGVIASAAIVTAVGAVVNLGIGYLMRALMSTPHQQEGKSEAAFGISGTVAAHGLSMTMIYANQLVHVAPGLEPLLRRVLDLPFRLGAKHPDEGGLDCEGLVRFLLTELWLQRGQSSPDTLAALGHFAPVWAASDPQGVPCGWRALMQPFDVLCWQDRTANALLHRRGHTEVQQWLHVALAVSPAVVVTSIINEGVQLLDVAEIRSGADEEVIALVRPQGLA